MTLLALFAVLYPEELCVFLGPAGRQDQLENLSSDPCPSPPDSGWAMLDVEQEGLGELKAFLQLFFQ